MAVVSRVLATSLIFSALTLGQLCTPDASATVPQGEQSEPQDPRIPLGCTGTAIDLQGGSYLLDFTCQTKLPSGVIQYSTTSESYFPGSIGGAGGVWTSASAPGYNLYRRIDSYEAFPDGTVLSAVTSTLHEQQTQTPGPNNTLALKYTREYDSQGTHLWEGSFDNSSKFISVANYSGDTLKNYQESNEETKYNFGPKGDHTQYFFNGLAQNTEKAVYSSLQIIDGEVGTPDAYEVKLNPPQPDTQGAPGGAGGTAAGGGINPDQQKDDVDDGQKDKDDGNSEDVPSGIESSDTSDDVPQRPQPTAAEEDDTESNESALTSESASEDAPVDDSAAES